MFATGILTGWTSSACIIFSVAVVMTVGHFCYSSCVVSAEMEEENEKRAFYRTPRRGRVCCRGLAKKTSEPTNYQDRVTSSVIFPRIDDQGQPIDIG